MLQASKARGDGDSLISFDPRTLAKRWQLPLALDDQPLHLSPSLAYQQDGDVLYVKYQLANGGWLFGARSLATGDVLWRRNPPGAELGSRVSSMYAKSNRLYVRVNTELQVVDGKNGERLGVVR